MYRFLLLFISWIFMLLQVNGQEVNNFELLVTGKDNQSLDLFIKNWENESLIKSENRNRVHEDIYQLYAFFNVLADSAKIYPYTKESKDLKWRILQDSLKIKQYRRITIDSIPLDELLLLSKGEILQDEYAIALTPNIREKEKLLLMNTPSGRSLQAFLNNYLVRFYDVKIRKDPEAIKRYTFAKSIESFIGKQIGFNFFMDGVLEWNLVDFPIIEEIELDEARKKAVIRYHYLLEGGWALLVREAVGSKWELVYSTNTWIR